MASWISSYIASILVLSLLLACCSEPAVSSSAVESLPGFQGPLPFELETGYVGVDESENVQLFYYFVKSESNPQEDPLVLWLNGGPGCSSITGFMYEIGPLNFKAMQKYGSLPELVLNPNSWSKVASIIFLDLPVGAGFSYARTSLATHSSDLQACEHAYQFLSEWLMNHPEFLSNPFYVGGDSYAGITVPAIVQLISNGNHVCWHPISQRKLKELLGHTPPQVVAGALAGIVVAFILYCLYIAVAGAVGERKESKGQRSDNNGKRLSHSWLNNDGVREALHIRKGSIGEWTRCNLGLPYTPNIAESFVYHVNLSTKGYRSLIYSGDHDLIVPFLGTQAWIRSLNYSIVNDWRSWVVEGQVAGYTRTYANRMTFATVKGGGHTAPEYKPVECRVMFERWISRQPL
ncbi:serine carboxypeptidase-like 7 [Rhododendron vialii]|uniref:serine carboxypeptidase-like 7 n=1 Tax=Rhododendron vialii TaxID=182163 RepID=UPI00265E9A5B|nr:serine carboxypeptidase-like 7 [Rhododendron vialii]